MDTAGVPNLMPSHVCLDQVDFIINNPVCRIKTTEAGKLMIFRVSADREFSRSGKDMGQQRYPSYLEAKLGAFGGELQRGAAEKVADSRDEGSRDEAREKEGYDETR